MSNTDRNRINFSEVEKAKAKAQTLELEWEWVKGLMDQVLFAQKILVYYHIQLNCDCDCDCWPNRYSSSYSDSKISARGSS